MSFQPTIPPDFESPAEAREWVIGEFDRLAKALSEMVAVDLRPIYGPPKRPREGMIVSADGAEWNPGSGAGAYEYKGGLWVKL